jgi:hypothetical protein
VTRKILSTLVATLVAFALFPAFGAQASAPGFARLTQNSTLLPGTNVQTAIQVFATTVPVNHVQFDLPTGQNKVAIGSATITPPDGWRVTKRVLGSNQTLIFRGGTIAPNANLTFAFPIDAPAPFDSDLSGTYNVSLSGDNGMTSQQAFPGPSNTPSSGTLTQTIKVLQVVEDVLLSPAGVLDTTGTGGQKGLSIRTAIRNFALSPLTVKPTLVSREGNSAGTEKIPAADTAGGPTTTVIPAGGSASFTWKEIELGPHGRTITGAPANRSISFNAGGNAVYAESTSKSASALPQQLPFTVQVSPSLPASGFKNLDPTLVAGGRNQTITVTATKQGVPALNLANGTLKFGPATLELAAPVSYPADGGHEMKLTFTGFVPATVPDPNDPTKTVSADGRYQAEFQFNGEDENNAAFVSPAIRPQDFFITIDSIGPIISVVLDPARTLDGDGAPQEAFKKGDSVTVTGAIDDSRASLVVELVPNVGATIPVAVSRTPATRGDSFIGQVKADFDTRATEVEGRGTGADRAGNTGDGFSGKFVVDNSAPDLTFGRTMSLEELSTLGTREAVPAAILVRFAEDGPAIKGGCNPQQYKIDGTQAVREVRYSDGSPCKPGERGPQGNDANGSPKTPSNERILVLAAPLGQDQAPSVTYTPIEGDRVKDRAGNFALRKAIDTVVGIVPPLPEIVQVYRNTATATADKPCGTAEAKCEEAYYDNGEDAYYTRFGGNDPIIQVDGARTGYRIEVLDAQGAIVGTSLFDASGPYVRATIPATDGAYKLFVRFVNAAGAGKAEPLTLVLDQVSPTIAKIVKSDLAGGKAQVAVTMSEFIPGGSNFKEDWLVVERLADGDRFIYPPDRVDGGAGTTRTMTVSLRNVGKYETVEYFFVPDEGKQRYFDRAGNTLADTAKPI